MALQITCQKADPRKEVHVSIDRHRSAGQYDQAIAAGVSWLRNNPDDALVHGQVALAYLQKDRAAPSPRQEWIDEAIQLAQKGIQLEPQDPRILRIGAIVFESAGDRVPTNRCQRYDNVLRLIREIRTIYSPEINSAAAEMQEKKSALHYWESRVHSKFVQAGC